jgi:hypothetical protein
MVQVDAVASDLLIIFPAKFWKHNIHTGTKGGSAEELAGVDTDTYRYIWAALFAQKPRGHQREAY